MSDDPLPAGGGSLTVRIGAWLAVVGTLISVGQAGTAWINGYWTEQGERARADSEARLAEIKERSALSQTYLNMILEGNRSKDAQLLLYDALANIEGHPLQKWGKSRYDGVIEVRSQLLILTQKRSTVAQNLSASEARADELQREIDELLVRARDVEEHDFEALQSTLRQKSSELAQVKADISKAQTKISSLDAARSESSILMDGVSASRQLSTALTASDVDIFLTSDIMYPIFSTRARENIDTNISYLQDALQEFKLVDDEMVALIVATLAIEVPNFNAYEESLVAGARYEGRLGNKQPGDGVRFRGRGYIGLTGRDNYDLYSKQLGLGSRLIDFPEDAKSPEVASRVAVAYFARFQARARDALAARDFETARRLVTGSGRDADRLQSLYDRTLKALTDKRTSALTARAPTTETPPPQ